MTRALEQTGELRRPLTPRCGERGVAVRIRDIGTGAGCEQAPDHYRVTTLRRDEKRGSSPSVGLFGVVSGAQESIEKLEIPRLGGCDQR